MWILEILSFSRHSPPPPTVHIQIMYPNVFTILLSHYYTVDTRYLDIGYLDTRDMLMYL